MTSGIDHAKLEAWCQSSITILGETGIDPKIVAMQRDVVARNSGKASLYAIADDLAEGLSHLPDNLRRSASQQLTEEFGFDFNLFVDRRLKTVKAILKRGSARNEAELQALSGFAADTTQSEFLLMAANKILAQSKRL